MSRLYLLVEGQTEETFVNQLLVPHYARNGRFLTPILANTSPGYRGGVVSYAKIRRQIENLCKEHHSAHVTTMFDLYALPLDFPGKSSPAYPSSAEGHAKASFLEAELAKDIELRNFIPNLLVHEFEALLLTRIEAFAEWENDERKLHVLRQIREVAAPEDINDSQHTAPSKRILAAMPGYQKTVHGPLIACEIGLDAIRAACPHFANWLRKIEALP